jgi:hypothetical protein
MRVGYQKAADWTMRGSAEWRALMEQELKELTQTIDRKADKSQLENLGSSPPSQSASPRPWSGGAEGARQHGCGSGRDLSQDFRTIFGAFNRVARQKLDASTLAGFATVAFVDSVYEKRSIEISAQLTESCCRYYDISDKRIESLRGQMKAFRETVELRLGGLHNRTQKLQRLVVRLQNRIGRKPAVISAQHANRALGGQPRRRTADEEFLETMTRELSRQISPARPAFVSVDLSRTLLPLRLPLRRFGESLVSLGSAVRPDSSLVFPNRDFSNTYHPGTPALFS